MITKYFSLVVTLVGFFLFSSCKDDGKKTSEEVNKDLEEQFEKFNQKRKESLEKDGALTYEQEIADVEGLEKALEKASEEAPKEETKVYQAMLESFKVMRVRYDELILKGKECSEALDLSKVDSIEKIDIAIQSANNLIAADIAYCEFMNNEYENVIRNALKKRGLTSKKIRDSIAGFNSTFIPRKKLILQIRATERENIKNWIKYLELLKSHFGKWNWDENQEGVVLEDTAPEDLEQKLNEIGRSIQEGQTKVESLQRQAY